MQRRTVRLTGSRGAAALFAFLARLAHVPSPSADWEYVQRPSFDNSIGELWLDGRTAQVTLQRAAREGEDADLLYPIHVTRLTDD
jgi:hypothetical protein